MKKTNLIYLAFFFLVTTEVLMGDQVGQRVTESTNVPVTIHWPTGQIKSKGTWNKRFYSGQWYIGYPSGKKEAELHFDSKGNLLSAQGWYEDGKSFFKLVPKDERPTATAGLPRATKARTPLSEQGLIRYFSPNGLPICSSSLEEGAFGYCHLYWPNGKLALEWKPYDDSCGGGSMALFDFQEKIFYELHVGLIGAGNDSHCGADDDFQSGTLGIMKDIPNGPMTLGCWDIGQMLPRMNDDKIFAPVLIADFRGGKINGLLHLSISRVTATVQFKDGLEVDSHFTTPSGYYK